MSKNRTTRETRTRSPTCAQSLFGRRTFLAGSLGAHGRAARRLHLQLPGLRRDHRREHGGHAGAPRRHRRTSRHDLGRLHQRRHLISDQLGHHQ